MLLTTTQVILVGMWTMVGITSSFIFGINKVKKSINKNK